MRTKIKLLLLAWMFAANSFAVNWNVLTGSRLQMSVSYPQNPDQQTWNVCGSTSMYLKYTFPAPSSGVYYEIYLERADYSLGNRSYTNNIDPTNYNYLYNDNQLEYHWDNTAPNQVNGEYTLYKIINANSYTSPVSGGDGGYFLKFKKYDNSNNFLGDFYTPIADDKFITFGSKPIFSFPYGFVNSTPVDPITIYKGCIGTTLTIQELPMPCLSDGKFLSVQEYDYKSQARIGYEIGRSLTSSELTNLQGGNLDIISFCSNGVNGHTLILQTGHFYLIKLVCVSPWKESSHIIYYKDGTYDLMMKDFIGDNGQEPSTPWSPPDPYRSPDLWNKLYTNGSPVNGNLNDNPDYVTLSGNTNRVFAKITNLGCQSSPENIPLRIFWTLSRTNEVWKHDWIYDLTAASTNKILSNATSQYVPLGSEITINNSSFANPYGDISGVNYSSPIYLNGISAGSSVTKSFDWYPPNPADYVPGNIQFRNSRPVICLLARIDEHNNTSSDPISWEPTGTTDIIWDYVTKNNNVATRNALLYDDINFIQHHQFNPGQNDQVWDYGVGTVIADPGFNNPNVGFPVTRNICIDLIPNEDITTIGTFNDYGTIDIVLTDGLWSSWGSNNYSGTNISLPPNNEIGFVTLTNGNGGCINNISFNSNMVSENIGVRFNYSGNNLPNLPINYTYRLRMTGVDTVVTDSNYFNGSNTIYYLTVPTQTPLSNGLISTGIKAINKNNDINLLIVYPNPSKDQLLVSCKKDLTGTCSLIITNGIGDIMKKIDCTSKTQFFTENIDTENWANGIYFIQYITNDKTVTKKIQVLH